MSESPDILGQRSLMIIFAYASAGLGHLRITQALYRGLPSQANPVLLAAPDKSITYLHRFSSIHPIARSVIEWLQSGEPAELFTRIVRSFLRNNAHALYQRIQTLLDQRFIAPDTILFVATHFGLAHQFAAIKDELIRTRGVKVLLVVQVTDDTPQRIWYVAGADLIVVPSEHTATELMQYGQAAGLPPVRFASLPYPVSPMLAQTLNTEELAQRQRQLNPGGDAEIQVAIPISGAAVGLTYFRTVIDELYRQSMRFRFHVISKVTPYTQAFLSEIASRPYVVVDQAATDLAVVEK